MLEPSRPRRQQLPLLSQPSRGLPHQRLQLLLPMPPPPPDRCPQPRRPSQRQRQYWKPRHVHPRHCLRRPPRHLRHLPPPPPPVRRRGCPNLTSRPASSPCTPPRPRRLLHPLAIPRPRHFHLPLPLQPPGQLRPLLCRRDLPSRPPQCRATRTLALRHTSSGPPRLLLLPVSPPALLQPLVHPPPLVPQHRRRRQRCPAPLLWRRIVNARLLLLLLWGPGSVPPAYLRRQQPRAHLLQHRQAAGEEIRSSPPRLRP